MISWSGRWIILKKPLGTAIPDGSRGGLLSNTGPQITVTALSQLGATCLQTAGTNPSIPFQNASPLSTVTFRLMSLRFFAQLVGHLGKFRRIPAVGLDQVSMGGQHQFARLLMRE